MPMQELESCATQASRLLRSLANPSRLLLLCALVEREHTAGELESVTGLGQSALSQHLALLRREGIVATRRDAQRIHYSLHDAAALRVLQTLHDIYGAAAARPQRRAGRRQ